MSTAIYNPFREIDRFLDQVAQTTNSPSGSMPLDLYRDGDEFVAKMDLPGVDPESIDINNDDRTLSVRAESMMPETVSDAVPAV